MPSVELIVSAQILEKEKYHRVHTRNEGLLWEALIEFSVEKALIFRVLLLQDFPREQPGKFWLSREVR